MLFFPIQQPDDFYELPAACDDCGQVFADGALRNGVCANCERNIVLEAQINDARRLLRGVAIEWKRGSREYALNGLKDALARLLVLAQEMEAAHGARYVEIYELSAIVEAQEAGIDADYEAWWSEQGAEVVQ